MSFQLTISEGKEAGKEFVFDQASVVIGRTSDCDVILYDPGVSRKHARIFAEGGAYFVEDMGSSNGTKVNGGIIRTHPLQEGDAVSLGPVVFTFSLRVQEEAEATFPTPGVTGQPTRIVSVDQVKRQRNRGVALMPEGADPRTLAASAGRAATLTMEALKRQSGPQPARRRPSTPPPPPQEDEDGPPVRPARPRPTTSANRPAVARPPRPPREAIEEGFSGDQTISGPNVVVAGDEGTGPSGENAKPGRSARRKGQLSAAERARIRRESKGMVGNLRIFWREASASKRAVLGVGGVGTVLMFLGVAYVLGLRDPSSEPSHAEPWVLARKAIPDSFGLGEGVTWLRADMKVFSFEFTAPGRAVVLLHFQAKDVSPGEVLITVNGADVGAVPADTAAFAERMHEVILPPSTLKRGQPNQIIFDNTKNPPGEDAWRIWNVSVETALLPEMAPELLRLEAHRAFERAQALFERRDVGAENRYLAWKTFRESWLMLEAHPEPKPELYLLAREKVKESQAELDRTCAKLLLEEESAFNQKDWNGARSTLDHIKSYFPANDQPCGFRAEQKRAEHGL